MRKINQQFNRTSLLSSKTGAIIYSFILLLLCQLNGFSQVTLGPENGSLLVIGGGRLDSIFYQKFMERAGGPDAPIVVIPTAGSTNPEDSDPGFKKLKNAFVARGFKNVTVLHTTSVKTANSKAFNAPILKAKGIWFTGGRQWRLMDAYFETKAFDSFKSVLENGGIIAGTSAGATIQGSFLARGDSGANTIMMGDHQEGFSLISNIAIDQHVMARNRQFDIFEILEAHQDLLGIGLDENTGILIDYDTFEVVGKSYVLVYDGTWWNAKKSIYEKAKDGERVFHLMRKGQKYNMATRSRL